jgi:lipopolysaccharide/colanic/teichoic acid biosynthesis glycosyltransferase
LKNFDTEKQWSVGLNPSLADSEQMIKRILDIIGALAALIFLWPLMLMIGLVIRLSGRGSVIFSQERFGMSGKKFRIYKFRTMVPNAEEMLPSIEHLNESCGALFKIKNDPRLTAFGKLLRRTSLDELPQLFNVLLGEMSLVGPRPLSIRDAAHFDPSWLKHRSQVRPGLTCLWQISGRSHLTSHELAQLDMQYLSERSLLLDLKILIKTIPVVLKGEGAV